MTFAEPSWLLAGLLVCGLMLWIFRRAAVRQRNALSAFASRHLIPALTASFSTPRRTLKQALFLAGTAFVFIALARPQWGFRWEETRRKGIDLLFAVDTSKSMLAEDVKPNRITRAKLAVSDLLDKLDGDRVGLIAFAGNAFLQSPLTLDYDAFRQSLDALDVGIVPRGGTDVASAIQEALAAFGPNTRNQKILVLITDGEDLEAKGIAAAKAAAKDGLKIYTIGVGSAAGELIPVPDEKGGTSFLKDESGNYVKSHLDESTLQQIAEATGATYAPLGQQGQGLETVYRQALAPLPKEEIQSRMQRINLERFQWPLALGIALLLGEMLIGTRKGRGWRRPFAPLPPAVPLTRLRPAKATVAATALVALAWVGTAGWVSASPQSAESAYKQGDYAQAESLYKAAAEQAPQQPALQFNLGAAAYKDKQFDQAVPAFQKSLQTDRLDLQEQAYYNLGTTQFRVGQNLAQTQPDEAIKKWQESVSSYDSALKLDAKDADAKFNRQVVQKKLDELKRQQEQKKGGQKKDDQKKDDQQQKQDGQPDKDQQSRDQQNQPPQPDKKDQKDQDGQSQSGQPSPGNTPPQSSPADQDKSGSQSANNAPTPQPSAEPSPAAQGEPSPTPGSGQPSPTPDSAQPSPTPGSGQPSPAAQGQPSPSGSPGQDQAENASAEPGQMTPQDAKDLLDSLKKDEHVLPAAQDARTQPKDQPVLKDW